MEMNNEAVSYSQWGEDLVIWDFFKRKTDGVFVEIGAHHPTIISQTYLLETKGWRGVLVEPLQKCYELLKDNRPGSQVFHCGAAAPGSPREATIKIPPDSDGGMSQAEVSLEGKLEDGFRYETIQLRTMDSVLEEAGLEAIDFLSIDVEGMEISALSGFDFARYRPKLILIEDHAESHDKHRFLRSKGYRFINRIGCNNWYVPKGFHDFSLPSRTSQFEFFRKYYLSMPFRKLRLALKSHS